MVNRRALTIATALGTILQVSMVVIGHSNKTIADFFAVGGMGFSLIAGVVYSVTARDGSLLDIAIGGLIAGGACAFIGIMVSYLLGDVPATLLLLGTVSSIISGAAGAGLGRLLLRSKPRTPWMGARHS